MGRFYFGTNLKMHQTAQQSYEFVQYIRQHADQPEDVQLFVIPPYTSLATLTAADNIWLGAQNMHAADAGEFTGEISPVMLKALGVQLVLLGHAERRQHFGETDAKLNRKVKAALSHRLRVLLCVGESAEDKYYGVGQETIARQLKIALHGVSSTKNLLIAYEPVWSIGEGGQPATVDEVELSLSQIHQTIAEQFGAGVVPVVYGGSVNVDNCAGYARLPLLDGLFVGRAARTAAGFVRVLQTTLAARPIR
jgi:L-erythrulose 1-phosphate isomerase